jgi:uridine kinase
VVIFVAGLSGAGKTVAASASGVRTVVPLDSFFFSARASLPRWLGRIDWETIESYDLSAAISAVRSLAHGLDVEIPSYDHRWDKVVGSTTIRPADPIIAEGVYAPDVFKQLAPEGLEARLLLIDTSVVSTLASRLRRDIGDRHMHPLWAVLRSSRLVFRHRKYRREVIAAGGEVVSRIAAASRIAAIAAAPSQ